MLFARSRRGGYLRLYLILGLMPVFTPSLTNRMFHNPEHEISQKIRALLGLCSSVLLFCETITWVTPVLAFFVESDTVQTVHSVWGQLSWQKRESSEISPLPNQLTALNPSPSAGRIWKLGAEKSKGRGHSCVDFAMWTSVCRLPQSHECSSISLDTLLQNTQCQ